MTRVCICIRRLLLIPILSYVYELNTNVRILLWYVFNIIEATKSIENKDFSEDDDFELMMFLQSY